MIYQAKITKSEADAFNKIYQASMAELKIFWDKNWVKNQPNLLFLNSIEEIEILLGYKPRAGSTGWVLGRTVVLLSAEAWQKLGYVRDADWWKYTIKHELAHLFYKLYSDGNEKPVWLWEGVAVYCAGGTQIKPRPKILTGFLDFYTQHDKVVYQEAGFFIEMLVEKFGKEKLFELIRQIKNIRDYSEESNKEKFIRIFYDIYGFNLNLNDINELYTSTKDKIKKNRR